MVTQTPFDYNVLCEALEAGDTEVVTTQFNRLVRIPGKSGAVVSTARKILEQANKSPAKNAAFKNAVEGYDGGLGFAFRFGPLENFKALVETVDVKAKVNFLGKITRDGTWCDTSDPELIHKVELLTANISNVKPDKIAQQLIDNAGTCDPAIFSILFDAVKDTESRDKILSTLSTYNAAQINLNYVLNHHAPNPPVLFAAMQAAITEESEKSLKILAEYAKTAEIAAELYRKIGADGLTFMEQLSKKSSDGSAYKTKRINFMRDSLVMGGAEIPEISHENFENSMARELIEIVKEHVPGQTFRAEEIGRMEAAFKKVITSHLKLLSQAKANEQALSSHKRTDGSPAAWTHRAGKNRLNEQSAGL